MYILKRFASKLSRSKYVKKDEILHKTKTNILSMKYTRIDSEKKTELNYIGVNQSKQFV